AGRCRSPCLTRMAVNPRRFSDEFPRCFDYGRVDRNRPRCCRRLRSRRRTRPCLRRNDQEGEKLESELRELGAEVNFVKTEVRYDDELRALIDATVARFGRLDIAVNCAGTQGLPGPVTEQTAETYAATFDTNVLRTLLSMK